MTEPSIPSNRTGDEPVLRSGASTKLAHGFDNIAGYRLVRLLNDGPRGAVYLGVAMGNDQPVALKILRLESTTDEVLKTRFLDTAAAHRLMVHRNILRVVELGEAQGACYLVTEYLKDGDLVQRLERGLTITAVIKVVKDIALALDHVHSQGFVHRDVKPENILFQEDGTAVLSDFGIAQSVTQQVSLSKQGTVQGTPEYMSPEQAAGRPLDGRADFYSLGVVLFRLLSGSLPYRAATPVSLALKHHQEPIPRLPAHLRVFQDIIDRLMAKRPEQRFMNGQELIERLDALRTSPGLPMGTIKTQPISTREIAAVGGSLLSTTKDPVSHERHARRRKQRRRLRMAAAVMFVLGSLGGLAFYAYDQGWLAPERTLARLGLGEDPQLAIAWTDAQSLRQDPNQGLAAIVAAYRRVLALDPNYGPAQLEVSSLAADWQQAISDALKAGQLTNAQAKLDEANAVFPNDVQWVQLDVELQNRYRAERILISAAALLTSNGMSDLPSATAAIASFQEVLRLAPDNTAALEALQDISRHYANLASEAAESGNVANAIALLERAAAADGALLELDSVRRQISQATTAQAAINDLLQQARRYRALNQLIQPAGENAAEFYQRVLATDPSNAIATQGLDEVTATITGRVDKLLAAGDMDAVSAVVTQVTSAGLNEKVIKDLRNRLNSEQERLDTVALNLTRARELMALGYLTAPANNNAVANLRLVQQLDPGNLVAQRLLSDCATRLAGVAKQAHEAKLYEDAEQYLDLALTISPEVDDWVILREQWATQAAVRINGVPE